MGRYTFLTAMSGAAGVMAVCWAYPAHARFHLPVHETAEELAHCASLDASMHVATGLDPRVGAYVDELGQELVRAAFHPSFSYTFEVVDDAEVNAYATCGGHVYVTTGLLHDVEDEAELAMVLGHEIAHNAQHHLIRNEHKRAILQRSIPKGLGLAAIPLYLFGVEGLLHVGREYEDEADAEGQKLAMRAGFDGDALVRLFRRWETRETRMPAVFRKLLSNHPSAAHRVRHAQRHKYTGAFLAPVRRESSPARFVAFKAALQGSAK